MGLFDHFKKLITGASSESLPSSATTIVPHIQHVKQESLTTQVIHRIPEEIVDLMWFFNGPLKNLDVDTKEPSGISFSLPVHKNVQSSKMDYYPAYNQMTPDQRYTYLTWLTDIDQPIDIGYVFVFFYGLERMITTPKYEEAVQMIHKLKIHHSDNGSFNAYSDSSLAYSALLHQDPAPTQYIHGTNATMLMLSKATFNHRLTATEIMSTSRDFGWDNTRYIKNEPTLFKRNLLLGLQSMYHQDYYPIPEKIDQVPRTQLHLANLTIATEERVVDLGVIDGYRWSMTTRIPKRIDIPDFSQSKIVSGDMYQLLKAAHNKTKTDLAEMRKNGERPKPESKKPIHEKRINPDTGYPLSTEKAIAYARELYNSTVAMPRHTPTGNAEYDEEMSILDRVLPHYQLGDLHYKLGEWKEAESEWLSILSLMGSRAAEKLAIMYHKQHRYKDEMQILSIGMKISLHSKVYPLPDEFSDRLTKASEFYAKHSDKDKSIGYKLPD